MPHSLPPARPAARWAALLASLCLGLLAALSVPAPASAHASLISSNPKDGAQLDTLPAEVTLTFSEQVTGPAFVVVTGPDGETVTDGDPVLLGPEVTQTIAADSVAGDYTLAYRVISSDGHPISAELGFTVTQTTAPTPTAPPSSAAPTTPAESPSATTSEPAAAEPSDTLPAPADESLWERHGTHFLIGGGLVVLAGALLLISRRTR